VTVERWPESLQPELEGCVNCGQCLPECLLYGLDRREETGPRGKLNVLKWHLLAGGAPTPAAVELFFRCSLCLRCQDACPAHLDLLGIFESARGRLSGLARPGSLEAAGRGRAAAGRFLAAGPWGRRTRPPRRRKRPAAPPAGAEPVLLAATSLEHATGRAWSMPAGALLGSAGRSACAWPIEGPSPFRQWWSGNLDGARASLGAVFQAAAGRAAVVFAEPELGWIARRLADPPAGEATGPDVLDLWDLLPSGRLSLAGSGRPFVVLPPPVPLDVEGWRAWNRRWEALAPERYRPLPEAWRAWRGEGLAVAWPGLARGLGQRLAEAILAAGAPDLVLASPRTWLWLRQSTAPGGLPACFSLPAFLLAGGSP